MARTFSFEIQDGRPCLLVTVTLTDETVIRVCTDTYTLRIDGETFKPARGLKLGDVTERNDGTVSSVGFNVAWEVDGDFDPVDIALGRFEGALVEIELTNAANPTTRDYWFTGLMLGQPKIDLRQGASFALFNKFGIPRDIFIRQYQLLCDADFGDPLRCKVPILPADVARLETIAVGDFRRARFTNDGDPEDYDNKYLEATAISTGITGAAAPSWNTTIGATTIDGGVTWTTRNAYTRAVRVSSVTNDHNFVIDRSPDPRSVSDADWFNPAHIAFRSGALKNRRFKVGRYSESTKLVSTFLPCLRVAANDWAEIMPGCDYTLTRCAHFDNVENYRGFPYQAGAKAQALQLGFG